MDWLKCYHHVAKESKADVLWQKLKTIYEQSTAHNKVNLMKRLINLKYKEGRSITKHTGEFQGLVDLLTTMKIILDDELQILLLFSSLHDSWKTLVVLENNSVPNEKLTLDMAKDRVRNKEFRRKSVEAVLSELDTLIFKKARKVGEKPKQKFLPTKQW